MDEFIGQCKITDGIIVLMTIEIVAITTEGLTQSMRIVKHRGDTVKTETIKLEFFKPILTVGEQEVKHVVLAIVETEGVPCGMLMTVAWIEELVWIATEIT